MATLGIIISLKASYILSNEYISSHTSKWSYDSIHGLCNSAFHIWIGVLTGGEKAVDGQFDVVFFLWLLS